MAKNSRPDIQVLEDRVVRLKSQLQEYKGLRLYGSTKRRLSAVSDELNQCLSIICEVVSEDSNLISSSSLSAYDESSNEGPVEFSDESDLFDTALAESFKSLAVKDCDYSPKEIVALYATRMKNCAETLGCSSGIVQVNQFCQLMNSWYQKRFTPENRNPNFYFKASKIHEWVDLLIIAAGDALHNNYFPKFVSDMNTWVSELNTPKDQTWALPYSIMQMKKKGPSQYSREAVMLERLIKLSLYDNAFYLSQRHSIEEIVIKEGSYSADELDLNSIIRSCSTKLIVTSSFNITKYQEVM